jgi:hypothetical protein
MKIYKLLPYQQELLHFIGTTYTGKDSSRFNLFSLHKPQPQDWLEGQ